MTVAMNEKELRAVIRKEEADLAIARMEGALVPLMPEQEKKWREVIRDLKLQLQQMVVESRFPGSAGGTGGVPPVSVKGKS